jgi:pyridoxal phosphate enzyme (YggS family)
MHPTDSNTISKNLVGAENYVALRAKIDDLCQKYGRNPESVTIVGASKRQTVANIQASLDAGLTDLGENFVLEGVEKQAALSAPDLTWHYIGHIQSNKTKHLAEKFKWIHTVDRFKIAQRLDQQTSQTEQDPLNILIQVNIDQEDSKSGVSADQAAALVAQCQQLKRVKVRGLMVIPRPRASFAAQCEIFAQTRLLLESITTN